jgi:peptidoglycan hydrolase-like protein with peptidoglycan-binding domain
VELDLLSEDARAAAAGAFDGATKRAVKAFQAAQALPATGVVDDALIGMLDEALVAHTLAAGVPAPVGRDADPAAVERLQALLVQAGLYPAKAFAKQRGAFTGKVAAGVRALQRGAGLPESGAVDAATWRALGAEVGMDALWGADEGGARVTGRPPLGPGQDLPVVEELERLLVGYGADLQPDTLFDKETRAAVRAFQQANGLTPDGRVGPATASALSSGGARPIGGRTAGLQTGADIHALTYADAVALVEENGGDLFVDGTVTVLAFRTANETTSTWDDYFVVLKQPNQIRVYAAVTRPHTTKVSGDADPAMLAPGNYDLKRRDMGAYGDKGRPEQWKDAFLIGRDGDGWNTHVDVYKDRGQDGAFSEEDRRSTITDPTIRLHRGWNGSPSSWGCLNVQDYDAFIAFVGGHHVPIDLTLVDLSETFGGGRA